MSKKNKKPQKLKARLPRGFVDREADDIRAVNAMMAKIAEVYERYGFDPIETPLFEFTDALGKFLPDSDRPNEGVFSLTDDDDQWMSLRYDLTAPLARHVAENYNELTFPYRTYRAGYVFRNEKPGPGRFRQFMQFDADTVGAPGVQADAEMCMMMADVMEALGIQRGDYVIRVNNRKVLDGVMEAIGLGGDENAERRLTVLRAIDKLDKFGIDGVEMLLGAGRRDSSGDFTEGAGLDRGRIETLINYLHTGLVVNPHDSETHTHYADRFADRPMDDMRRFRSGSYYDSLKLLGKLQQATLFNDTLREAIHECVSLIELVERAGYGSKRIHFDPSCVRGLEYYTGTVFEAELKFPVKNEKGQEVVFGSVGGGGRYDGLVSRFMGQPVPATGFSIGVSRLMTALKNNGLLDQDKILAPVLVTVMDGDAMGAYQKMVQDLRQAGIRAEMYQGNWKKFPNQLRYADKRGCPIAIIQGSDEREKGVLQIKDMIEGKKEAAAIESNEEYRAARPGQFEINEADLVAEVQKLLAEQDGAE